MEVKILRLSDRAVIPVYGSNDAACFDLSACIPNNGRMQVSQGGPAIPTGLAFEIPKGYAMLIFSRSGHGFNNGVRLGNCVGVIDSDYRGEVKVKLVVDNGYPIYNIENGSRIAQAMIIPYPKVSFVEGDLSDTERGAGGFGSTGN